MVNLLVAGVMALDDIKTPFGEVKSTLGGAANYSSVAASLFTKVGVTSIIGKDMPEENLEFIKSRGIDISGVKIDEGKTMRWNAEYKYDMNEANTLDTQLNVFLSFDPALPHIYKKITHALICPLPPKIQMKIIEQLENPKMVALDTIKYYIDNHKEELLEVIKKVDIIFFNDDEVRQLCGTPNLIRAAKELQKMGPKIVIIKKGEHGSLLFNGDNIFSACAYPLETVKDPTGAGDSFAGGMMGCLASTGDTDEQSLRKALMCGTAVASYNAEHFGLNKLKTLTKEEINQRLERLKYIMHF